MRVKYNAEITYAPVNIFVGNNDLMVVTVNDQYVAIGDKTFTENLDEAIILHPEYARKLKRDLEDKNPYKEVYIWRYVDLLRYSKSELKKAGKIIYK